MNKKKILLFVFGLTVSLIVSSFIYYLLFLETVDIFGFEALKDPETRHAKIFYTASITTLGIVLLAVLFNRMSWRNFALGFVLPAAAGIVPIVLVGQTFLKKENYYEEFNREKWLAQEDNRLKMARHLIKKRTLIGLTKEEVVAQLGTGFYIEEEMNYPVYDDFCGLGIHFRNNKVDDYSIWVKD
ncbi:MAG TPA: hypothetical protein VGK39_00030 [Cyclobacteriaceae bacterium]